MQTPICDFVKKYNNRKSIRLHMPGHKGKKLLGVEYLDVTEIDGADCLFNPNGIILESQKNAQKVFGFPTFYSTEGSTHCIKSLVFLLKKYALSQGEKPLILAGRNCHKAFIDALGLCDLEVEWIQGSKPSIYLSCDVDAKSISQRLTDQTKPKPTAVYLTTPDYLGNIVELLSISKVCKKNGVLLAVDNAHGAYLSFLEKSLHPIDLGADIVCSSAHKTLPVLTGGAYLQISNNVDKFFLDNAVNAMSTFGSTSPSYVILQSLDKANVYLENNVKAELRKLIPKIEELKRTLNNLGFQLLGNEPLKITILPKSMGYTGVELAKLLKQNNIFIEAYDNDYLVMMFSTFSKFKDISKLEKFFGSIKPKPAIIFNLPTICTHERKYSIRKVMFLSKKLIKVSECNGKVFAGSILSCPPAVPIIIAGEIIDQNCINLMQYYNLKECWVIDE